MAISKMRLRFLVFLSLLETVLFGGLQYGWSSLLFILKSDGFFENLCPKRVNESANITVGDSGKDACFSQDERFNLLFSIGIAILATTNILSGQMHYKLGTKRTRSIKLFVFTAGVLFLGFASKDTPWLVLPGLICVGVAGLSLLISDMQVAVLLKQGSSIYVGIMNGFFDSSVLTQRVVKVLYENGINRLYSYSGIAVLMLIISGSCTALFPAETDNKDVECKKDDPIDKDINTVSSTVSQNDNKLSHNYTNNNEKAVREKEKGDNLQSLICSRKYIFHLLWLSVMMLRFFYFLGSINRIMEETFNDNDKVSYFTDVMAYTMMGGAVSSFLSGQLLHWQNKCFSGHLTLTECGWYYLQLAHAAFTYINTDERYSNEVFVTYQFLNTSDTTDYFKQMSKILFPLLALFATSPGYLKPSFGFFIYSLIESYNKVLPLSITSGLAVLLSCMTFITTDESFYATFIILTIFRSFVFCVNMDYIIDTFPKKYMSILFGLAISAAGIISLMQYALFLWTDEYEDALKHVNVALLVLSCVSFLHPTFLVLDAIRTPKKNDFYTSHL